MSFVGVSVIMKRMALDRILPQFFLKEKQAPKYLRHPTHLLFALLVGTANYQR
jgi:hypothetical protein